MDLIDNPIVHLLGSDALQSSESVARKLGLSAATVRRRIRKLVKDGTLRVVAVVDPERVGLPLAALLAIDVPYERLQEISDQLSSHAEVKWVSTMTGRFNIMALVRTSSTYELSHFMQTELTRLEGVRNAETLICLNVKKGRYVTV